ncbi:protein sorting system archaetidylserine decarboxylase [Halobaculum sp. MBLA0147]|uniref:protein sorting system archaetidylserine decarboxylase n=1 Tax=Halobaculum sp. MBLA0147 TaxID=3079934 RepID=UPI0035261828
MDTTLTTRFAPALRRWALPLVGGSLASLVLLPPATPLFVGLTLFVVWFFRDPEREPPEEGVLAPADGHVSVIRTDGDRVRVGVFMSPLDVHVTRAPTRGTVERLDHRPGAHRPAFSKESERNERVEFRIDDVDGALIAGWFARRISPYVSAGQTVDRGERIGHIAFGSRADVVLPERFDRDDVRVETGAAVRAGETVLAYTDEDRASGTEEVPNHTDED